MIEQMIEAAMKAMREEERANQNLELGFDDDVYDLACLTIAAIEPFIEGALKDRIEALTAENERLREALKRIARYDVGLQSLIEDGVDTPENRAKYYEGRVEYRRSIARAALPETDETFTHPDNV